MAFLLFLLQLSTLELFECITCDTTPHSEAGCVYQFEMHLIASWPFVSVQARPIALFDLLLTQLAYSDPHNKCVNPPSYSLSAVTVCYVCRRWVTALC